MTVLGAAARSATRSAAQSRSSSSVTVAPGGEGDVGDRYLAGVRVGAADRRGRGDLRVGEQRVLDDRGVDVVAAADDQVLGPAGQVDEAVLVDAGEVAGVEPAVDQLAEAVQDVAVVVAADDVAGEHGRAR